MIYIIPHVSIVIGPSAFRYPQSVTFMLDAAALIVDFLRILNFFIEYHRNSKASSWPQRASIQPVHQPQIDDCVF
ncbi:hypothetical protein EYC80_002403 [Monilinia laxa]|uniref:Uncharacterized protein n=1 Tax=Monilinia laxa TaxID=61186 RepID=A0A5N6K3P3_MONLA|nr:hypothetical protein EYC80_002403 [Monilinia laxa]